MFAPAFAIAVCKALALAFSSTVGTIVIPAVAFSGSLVLTVSTPYLLIDVRCLLISL